MKTSNKLLIAFASALILIPVLGIAIVSGLYYEKNSRSVLQNVEMDTFGIIPKNTTSIAVNVPFESITIDGGKQQHLVIKLVKDEKTGVRFPDNMKGLVTAQVDRNGQLQIVVKATGKERDNYTRISVYGPDIKELNVVDGKGIDLNAEIDSLALNLSHTGSAHFNPDTRIGQLNVRTVDVQNISFRETGTKTVILDLKNTNVRTDMSSFDKLSIHAAGTSEIELNGGYGEKTDKVIKHLTLNTLGKAKVKVINMQIDQCAGRFSDSTSVEMPAVNINQMYNTKQ